MVYILFDPMRTAIFGEGTLHCFNFVLHFQINEENDQEHIDREHDGKEVQVCSAYAHYGEISLSGTFTLTLNNHHLDILLTIFK